LQLDSSSLASRMTNKDSNIISINDLKKVVSIFRKNWWILVIALVVFALIAQLYTYKLTDVYAAKTQILLKSNDQYNTGSIISDNFGGFYGSSYKTYVDNSNEMRVIKSYDIIERVIDRLNFEVSYFIMGRLKTSEVFEGVPFKVRCLSLNPQLYEQQMSFKILNSNEYSIGYKKGEIEHTRQGVFGQELVDTDFKFVVERNNALNENSINTLTQIEYLIQIHNKQNLISRFQSSLQVENPEYTNIMQLTVDDVIPGRAVMFLDTLAQVYIENTLKSRLEINYNTLLYIDRQMREVTNILDNIEDTMQDYKEVRAILDLDREGQEYFTKLSRYDGQKTELELQLGSLRDLENYIIQDKDPEFLPPSVYLISGDGFLGKSVTELYNLQIARNIALVEAKPESFAIQQVNKQIEALKKNLLTYIGNTRKALKERISNVSEQISNYIGNIKTLPQKQRGLVNIQRKLKVNEDMYLFLLQKKANTIIARASIIPETKVIESARSMGVISPNKPKILYSFLGAGLIIALCIVFVRTVFYERVESYEELKAATTLPILGEVLFSPSVKELSIAVENEPKSPLAESFRTIRTNLQYMAISPGPQSIVITSNNPGEGKTFCSLNLASIFAKAGKKVLLLELDLHKPRVQKGLNMQVDSGITTIVIGKTSIEQSIYPTSIENLDVILSGPLPPNPSELVLSPKLAEIIQYGKQHYDYVIIDTPPVGLISDALILMKMADISLFVLNTKVAYKEAINNAHEIVKFNKVGNFGFILNGVKRKRARYYYNKYSYGYGYGGYGYGSYGGEK
jgi:capsular exopolysaccharide synthesis family protein